MAKRIAGAFHWTILLPLAGAIAGAVACSGSSGTPPSTSAGCSKTTDCAAGEACVDGVCHQEDADASPAPCATVECNGVCCTAGQTCQGGVCKPAPVDAGQPCATVECGGACCPAGDTCENGACTPPAPACSTPGESCSPSVPCCQSGTGVGSSGAVCITNDNACHAKCTANSQCTSGCCAGVQGESYGVCAAQSDCAPLGGTGDACSTNAACASGTCTEWCAAACSASNAVCAGGHGTAGLFNEYGQPNWCLLDSAGTDVCFPGCTTNADCSHYAGTTCKRATDVTGYSATVCAL